MTPIPQGYKQTEIGVIPEDWVVGTTREIIQKMTSGLSRRLADHDIGMPVIISGNIQNNKLDISDLKYWYKNDPQGADTNDYVLNDGDILLCFINSLAQIGKPCIYRDIGRPVIYTTNLFRIVISESSINEFAYYLFSTEAFQKNLQLISKIAVNQASFTKPDFLNSKIAYPKSKSEQTAIATALSDVDALITGLESLIAKKQAIKTATMQQLLTGKTRLPQFAHHPDGTPKGTQQTELGEIPEDWGVVEFGSVLKEFRNGYAFSASGYASTGTPIITMAQIGLSGSFQFDISKVNKWDSLQYDLLKDFWVRDGDLLIAMTDVTPDKNLIGQMTIAKLDGIALLNQRVGLLRLKNEIAYSGYFNFLSCLPVWRAYCKGVASLGVQANIGTSDIRKAKVPLPPIKEQSAIAQVLSDMDEEIQTLQTRLSKTQHIKQGMMQQLLTGKVRLIKPSKEVIHE